MIILRQRLYGATIYDKDGVASNITSTDIFNNYKAAKADGSFTGTLADYKTQNYGSLKGSTFGNGIGTIGTAQAEANAAANTYRANQETIKDLSKGLNSQGDLDALKNLSTDNKAAYTNTQNKINTTYGTSTKAGVHVDGTNKFIAPKSPPTTTTPKAKPLIGWKGKTAIGLAGVGYLGYKAATSMSDGASDAVKSGNL